MRQDYFTCNGKRYHTGTIVVIANRKMTFLYFNTDNNRFAFKNGECVSQYSSEYLGKHPITICSEVDGTVKLPVLRKKRELSIDGMLLGWMWYIFIMGLAVIFNDRIGIWILASWIFFSWRKNKIEKEGMYYERQI